MKAALRRACVLACCLAASTTHAFGQTPLRLSVADAVHRATELNEDVLVSRAEAARLEGIVHEVRSNSLPEITANFGLTRNIQTPVLFFDTGNGVRQISIGNNNDYAFSLSLEQPVLDFALGPARRAARLTRDASSARVDAVRNQVALAARTQYYQLLLDQELVTVQEKALAQADRRLAQVEDFRRAGTASEFDLLTAQVEAANIRPELIEARNRQALDANQLKRTIGLALDQPILLTDDFLEPAEPPSLDVVVARALEQRDDLKAQQLAVALQQQRLSAERKSALPKLSVAASFLRRASSDRLLPREEDFSQTTTAGIAFELPLFDGGSRAGRIQQAAAAIDRERFREAQLARTARLQVQQAHQAMTAALEQIQASESNVSRAARALEIAQTRFKNGLSTQVELNDAELAVTRARSNYARSRYNYSIANAAMLAATGER